MGSRRAETDGPAPDEAADRDPADSSASGKKGGKGKKRSGVFSDQILAHFFHLFLLGFSSSDVQIVSSSGPIGNGAGIGMHSDLVQAVALLEILHPIADIARRGKALLRMAWLTGLRTEHGPAS